MTKDIRPGSPRRAARTAEATTGFSLIELMIVVAIIAILAAIAWPAYRKHVIRSHRVAAEACLSEYANYMERYYTTYLRYDKDPASGTANPITANPAMLDCASASQTGDSYKYVPASAATSFTIQAQPQNGQVADTQCGTLSIDQTGTRGATDPATCW